MKILITGTTGFIGREVLRQCLQHPEITQIISVTRRPLPDELGSPKIRQVLLRTEEEWLSWNSAGMSRWLEGCEACIWCLGGPSRNFLPSSGNGDGAGDGGEEVYKKVTHDYTLTAANSLSHLATPTQKFRFCYLSAWSADVTERKWRPFEKKSAYIKGRTEKSLFEFTKDHPLQVMFELYTFRPGSVVGLDGKVGRNGFSAGLGRVLAPRVGVLELAGAMVDVGFHSHFFAM
ncbi:hypothetical protein L873DRAFT_760215 [Choiromyces venosus 120613-1]|uniref:NAD-dependent epimerase/dehydratase domain-containing protein n=1 Tax=Choiromyces venosus 120613-1 TaxID=1336337 RepID=A0A3N4JQV7_9PEZI|nr:hypothetical protein L873DRAFT_760215 [Choiromyces venosus 120613-1]